MQVALFFTLFDCRKCHERSKAIVERTKAITSSFKFHWRCDKKFENYRLLDFAGKIFSSLISMLSTCVGNVIDMS